MKLSSVLLGLASTAGNPSEILSDDGAPDVESAVQTLTASALALAVASTATTGDGAELALDSRDAAAAPETEPDSSGPGLGPSQETRSGAGKPRSYAATLYLTQMQENNVYKCNISLPKSTSSNEGPGTKVHAKDKRQLTNTKRGLKREA